METQRTRLLILRWPPSAYNTMGTGKEGGGGKLDGRFKLENSEYLHPPWILYIY